MDSAGETVGYGRRLLAFMIDTVPSVMVALLFTRPPSGAYSLAVSAAFTVERTVLTALTGASLGQRLVGIEVRRLDGRPVGLRAVVRSLMWLLLIPLFLEDKDKRGLHDRVAGTRLVRSR